MTKHAAASFASNIMTHMVQRRRTIGVQKKQVTGTPVSTTMIITQGKQARESLSISADALTCVRSWLCTRVPMCMSYKHRSCEVWPRGFAKEVVVPDVFLDTVKSWYPKGHLNQTRPSLDVSNRCLKTSICGSGRTVQACSFTCDCPRLSDVCTEDRSLHNPPTEEVLHRTGSFNGPAGNTHTWCHFTLQISSTNFVFDAMRAAHPDNSWIMILFDFKLKIVVSHCCSILLLSLYYLPAVILFTSTEGGAIHTRSSRPRPYGQRISDLQHVTSKPPEKDQKPHKAEDIKKPH